jgi:hypothetical protein
VGQAKKNRPEGRSFSSAEAEITWQQRQPKQRPKQQPKRQQQRQQRSKQQPKRQQQRQQLEQLGLRLRQQLERQQERSRLLELLELGSLQLFWCKQPEQQPSGKRSAGIFSWVFLF